MIIRGNGILVVDDEDAIRNMVCAILTREGYPVFAADDGDGAGLVYQQHQSEIGLLITDVSMPGKDGCELALSLQEANSKLKVLYISGSAGSEIFRYYGMAPEGTHFLQKPFRPAELLGRVKSLLGASTSVPQTGKASG